jgi:peptide/nickel transport system substrate-binding protein
MCRLTRGRFVVSLSIFFLFLAWQVNPALAETPKRGGRLTIAAAVAPVGLDLHISKVTSTLDFAEHIYETLVRWNYKMEVEPCLATSWEHPDDKE